LLLTACALCLRSGPAIRGAIEERFDTNRVMEVRIQIDPAEWKVLRYQHRESDFFPEANQKPATNA